MLLSPLNRISPLSPKRSGVGATPLISTMKHEWYFNNVQNASADIITIPDTGTVGGLDISNPALANKPTQSSIGTKISWAADGVDDYMYKATTNFMRSYPTWMVTVVFKYDSSKDNRFLTAWNGSNTVNEGISFTYSTSVNNFRATSFSNIGTINATASNTQLLVNGQNYIVTYGWNGTDVVFYLGTTNIGSVAKANPLLQPSSMNNISTTSIIRPSNPSGNVYDVGNIGYIGVDEFDLTRLNNNVATLKSTFGIAPANTVAPVISGNTALGSTLTTTNGTWTGTTPITYTYQWKRGGVAISGATNNTYTTVTADIGENITCEVTATNSFGFATATSNAIVVISETLCSYFFDGTDNNIELPTSIKSVISGVSKEFSLIFVLRKLSNEVRIFDNWFTGTTDRSLLIDIDTSGFLKVQFSSDGLTNSGNWTSNDVYPTGWNMLVVNYNNGVVTVYNNGAEITGVSTTIPTTLYVNSISPRIGGFTTPFNGYINQFASISREVTSSEVTSLWNGGSPRVVNELISNDYTYIFDNDTWNGSNFTVINSESGGNAVTSGMSAVDKDCNENPY